MRAFVALDLSAEVRAALVRLQAALRTAARGADVRWATEGQLHVTLKFLGSVPPERVADVVGALERIGPGFAPIALEARGLGGFPTARRPRVVWAGMGGDLEALRRLAAAVEAGMTPLGFPPEERAFRGHLTLGRVRSPRRLEQLVRALERAGQPELGSWTASELVLYESKLQPSGAVYEAVARIGLGNP